MSAPQFTPGPWLIHHKHRWVVPAEDAFKAPADALPICQLRDPDERLTEDETLDNGFLIAAAPELYEACRRAKHFIENGVALGFIRMPDPDTPDSAHTTLPTILAALAKARGEQQ